MSKFDEYLAYAAICRQKAAASGLEDDKRQWLHLAQFWQGLIQTPDRHASNPGGELPEDGGNQTDRFVRPPTQIASDIVDSAWGPATAEDFRYEEAVGERPSGMTLIHWYTGRIHERCAHDTSLALAFYRVMHMIDPPAALFRPSVIARVLRKLPTPVDRVSIREVMAGVHR
jgi:hypothetical protein